MFKSYLQFTIELEFANESMMISLGLPRFRLAYILDMEITEIV